MTETVRITSSDDIATGFLPTGGVQVITMSRRPLPANCSLVTSNVSAKIEIQNGPTSPFFEPLYDRDAGGEMAVSISVGVNAVRFTGTAGDAWSIT